MDIIQLYKKFDHWMNYQPPGSMTSHGWKLFDEEFERKAPIRFWIRKKLVRGLGWGIKRKFRRVVEYFRDRVIFKYHYIPTGHPPGFMSDGDRMINANFKLLVDYVEKTLARISYFSKNDKNFKQRFIPFYLDLFPIVNKDLGMQHLEWETTLDDPSLPPHERSERQARTAREIIELYNWWSLVRPARSMSELPGYSDQGLGFMAVTNVSFNHNAPDYVEHTRLRKINEKLTEDWKNEDTEMLIRLVKIRDELSW